MPELEKTAPDIEKAFNMICESYLNDGTLFACGNGGSACDAEHIVGELMKSFIIRERPVPLSTQKAFCDTLGDENHIDKLQAGLRAISLHSHLGLSSAYVNDVDPLMVYAQQLFVLGRKGDVLIGISTSGNAVNVRNVFKTAKAMGIGTILMAGLSNGTCEKYADCIIRSPEKETYRIQEYHLPIYHCLCMMLEERFYGGK